MTVGLPSCKPAEFYFCGKRMLVFHLAYIRATKLSFSIKKRQMKKNKKRQQNQKKNKMKTKQQPKKKE